MTTEQPGYHPPVQQNLGTYSIQLKGLGHASILLSDADPDWPTLTVDVRMGNAGIHEDRLDDASAAFRLQGGASVVIDRSTSQATFRFPSAAALPNEDELIHPYLFGAAATINHWCGYHTFHAGAFVVDDGAWAIAGVKCSGKSSTLGWLASRGLTVMTDDLLVISDNFATAGPSCVDLRPDAAKRLGVGENIGVVGARERWRYVLPPSPRRVALRGWIFPTWSDTFALDVVPPIERIPMLMSNLALRTTPPRPDRLLALASLPSYVFGRPRGWDSIAGSVSRLIERLSG